MKPLLKNWDTIPQISEALKTSTSIPTPSLRISIRKTIAFFQDLRDPALAAK